MRADKSTKQRAFRVDAEKRGDPLHEIARQVPASSETANAFRWSIHFQSDDSARDRADADWPGHR